MFKGKLCFVHGLRSIQQSFTFAAFTFSKPTIEPLQKSQNLFRVDNKDTSTTSLTWFWSLLSTLNKFHTLLWCFYCWIWTSKNWLGKMRVQHMHILLRIIWLIQWANLLKVNSIDTRTMSDVVPVSLFLTLNTHLSPWKHCTS